MYGYNAGLPIPLYTVLLYCVIVCLRRVLAYAHILCIGLHNFMMNFMHAHMTATVVQGHEALRLRHTATNSVLICSVVDR